MLDYKGYTLEQMKGVGTRERINRDVHPDDLERVEAERRLGLSTGVPFEMEKRLLGEDGQFRWFLFRYNPVVDEDGDVVRWFATATDIEERKQAEDRMRNETVALRETIVRSSMLEETVGSSPALRRVLTQVEKVAATDSTVLIRRDRHGQRTDCPSDSQSLNTARPRVRQRQLRGDSNFSNRIRTLRP